MRPLTPLATNALSTAPETATRQTGGGCYDVRGTQVSRVADGPAEEVGLDRWRARQMDLWAESSAIIHLDRHLTAEESGLFLSMWRELEVVGKAVARLEADHPTP